MQWLPDSIAKVEIKSLLLGTHHISSNFLLRFRFPRLTKDTLKSASQISRPAHRALPQMSNRVMKGNRQRDVVLKRR